MMSCYIFNVASVNEASNIDVASLKATFDVYITSVNEAFDFKGWVESVCFMCCLKGHAQLFLLALHNFKGEREWC